MAGKSGPCLLKSIGTAQLCHQQVLTDYNTAFKIHFDCSVSVQADDNRRGRIWGLRKKVKFFSTELFFLFSLFTLTSLRK